MSVGYSLLETVIKTLAILLAGVNIVAAALLIRAGTMRYVLHYVQAQKDSSSHLRLQAIWLIVMVVISALVLSIVLPQSLADQIIAAWFVGQGFALQPYVQSFLTGFTVRSNPMIKNIIMTANKTTHVIKYNQAFYTIAETDSNENCIDILSITLQGKESQSIITVPWTQVASMEFIPMMHYNKIKSMPSS